MNERVVELFAKFIERELGIVYADFNLFQLHTRLEDVCRQLKFKSVDELWARVTSGLSREHKQFLLDVATNNETSFFRDSTVFELLGRDILPGLLDAGAAHVWCAACSYGQAPLSISMLLRERAPSNSALLRILATDVSQRALTRAGAGLYSALEVSRGLSPERRDRYFQAVDKNWFKARESVLEPIQYRIHNLLSAPAFDVKFGLIMCRNVLIYQSFERKAAIVTRLHEALAPNGYLVLGAGEGLIGLTNAFQTINSNGAVVYRRR